MRILHVVTLVSPDGAFGGPVRVAVNLAAGLRDAGHDVVLAGACRGYDDVPDSVDGIPAKLFRLVHLSPGISFAGASAPGLMRWLRTHVSSFDVVHVHLGRDLVTLPAARTALRKGVPLIAQTHGMIVPISNPIARLLDAVRVNDTLRRAAAVLYLSDHEAADLRRLAGGLNLCELPNGVPAGVEPVADRASRPEMVFMARVHPRKRPELFVQAALRMIDQGVDARFTVIGPPGGAHPTVRRLIDRSSTARGGPGSIAVEPALDHDAALRRLASARAFVLPSFREPFAMTILESLSVGTPVIVGTDGGLSDFVERSGSGLVVDGSVEAVETAMRRMINQADDAHQMGCSGRAAVERTYGMAAIIDRLLEIYRRSVLA